MPSLSRSLEQALHRAIKLASDRHHEYATLEHLLLALIDDTDAGQVMKACNVDMDALRKAVQKYVDEELITLVIEDGEEAKPTTGFQRVVQRAVLHVQNSGRDEVTGANVLVALFTERESHAVYFLQEQNMNRLDAVSYISHGIAKRPGMSQPKPVARRRRGRRRREGRQAGHRGAGSLLRQPEREGQVGPRRSADRPRPPKSTAPSRSCAAARRTIRCSWAIPAWARPPSPKAWRARSSRTKCPKCCAAASSIRSTWAR